MKNMMAIASKKIKEHLRFTVEKDKKKSKKTIVVRKCEREDLP